MSRATVRRYVAADAFPESAPHRRRPSQLLPYVAHLERRWAAGCTDGVRLWKEIQAQGYGGSRRMVAQWACQRRLEPAPRRRTNTGGRRAPPAAQRRAAPPAAVSSGCSCTIRRSWIRSNARRWRSSGRGAPPQRPPIPCCGRSWRWSAPAPRLVRTLAGCGGAERPPGAAELRGGAQARRTAVLAALALPWSNGPLEGFVNKIKTIKRQMYGRASFPMLRQRVLLAA